MNATHVVGLSRHSVREKAEANGCAEGLAPASCVLPYERRLRAVMAALLLIAAGLALTGCESSGADNLSPTSSAPEGLIGSTDGDLRVVRDLAPPPEESQGKAAALAANDLIEVDVFGVEELDRTTRIDERGSISLSLIGQVQAAGLTASELESEIERRYGQNYLQSPEVSVFVKESFGQRVTMDGEFRKPGILPVTSQSTLLQVVAEAGGLSDIANVGQVYVFRTYPTGKQVAAFSLSDIRAGKARDPRIFGGDVVVAFPSGARVAARNLREALGIATSASSLVRPF